MRVRVRRATPTARAAIAVLHVEAAPELSGADASDAVDAVLDRLGVKPVGVGCAVVRTLGGIDEALVVRPTGAVVQLHPHGSPAVVDAVCAWLASAGVVEHGGGEAESGAEARRLYPEAASEVEALALATLARAASRRAVEALLRQPGLWADRGAAAPDGEHDRVMDRLVRAPTVVAIGPTNIGKSSLLNALAGRSVAAAADEEGTTRDHVGAAVELDGVAVRWLDLPGVRAEGERGKVEASAAALARAAAAGAELVVLCADAGAAGFVDPRGPDALPGLASGTSVVRCRLRADRAGGGDRSGEERAVRTSAATGAGLAELASAVRRALVPDGALAARRRWRFHPALGPAVGAEGG